MFVSLVTHHIFLKISIGFVLGGFLFLVQQLTNKPFLDRLTEIGFGQLPKIVLQEKSEERNLCV